MRKSILIFLVFVLTPFLIFLLLYLTRNTQKDIPETSQVLTNDAGQPQMATGNCNNNSDCFQTGCSSQVCANHEVVTTCEFVYFPEKETYSCGCIQNRCVWYR